MGNPTDQPGVKPGEGTPSAPPTEQKPVVPPTSPDGGSSIVPPGTTTPPAGGEGKPNGGKEETVPKGRFEAEVSRWRERAEKAESKLSAQSLVPGGKPTETPAAPPAGTPSDGTPPGTPGTQPQTQDTARFVTREELERKARVDELAAEGRACIQKYDGSNGYPVFDIDKVTDFMKERGITSSYEDAYFLMHKDEIRDVDIAKAVEDATAKNTPTLDPKGGEGTGHPPAQPGELSREGIAKMSTEEFKKSGGAKGLRDKVLGGQIK